MQEPSLQNHTRPPIKLEEEKPGLRTRAAQDRLTYDLKGVGDMKARGT